MGGLGVNQTWKNVTSSRITNVNYTNRSNKPILVYINLIDNNTYGNIQFYINNVLVFNIPDLPVVQIYPIVMMVPSLSNYRLSGNAFILQSWSELS